MPFFLIIVVYLPPISLFVYSLDSMFIPKSTCEVMADPRWQQAMLEEMVALGARGT